MTVAELDLLDNYFKNTLSEEERISLENRMKEDPSFQKEASEHLHFLNSLQGYSVRKEVKHKLDTFHQELTPKNIKPQTSFGWNTWTTLGMAASVAFISALATFFMVRSYDNEHQADYQELRKNVDRLKKSIDNIKSNKKPVTPSKYSGSGFMVSANGYIATSYHVIKSADSIYVENEKFGRLKTSFVFADDTADIALLLITDDRFVKPTSLPYLIRSQEASIGEDVYTLGFPREDVVYGDGSISATSGYEQNKNSYQVSIPVNPGNSGGPMIDQNGSVAGIINGVQTETRGAAFAIKSQLLLKVIQEMPQDSLTAPLKVNLRNQLAGTPRVNQISRWKDFVFMVKVYNGK